MPLNPVTDFSTFTVLERYSQRFFPNADRYKKCKISQSAKSIESQKLIVV